MTKRDPTRPATGTIDELREAVKTTLDPRDRFGLRVQLALIDAIVEEADHLVEIKVDEILKIFGDGIGFGIWAVCDHIRANTDREIDAPQLEIQIEMVGRTLAAIQYTIQRIIIESTIPNGEPIN